MASFSVVSNISAVNAQANLTTTNVGLQKALERLSSGYRINRSGDDAAGLVVANTYRSEQAVLTQGIRNAGDGLSTLQIKDGALNNISTLLDRLATLATQSASSAPRSTARCWTRNSRTSSRKSTVKRAWPASTPAQGFSVFVSNDGANGVIGGTIGAADTTTLGVDALAVDTAANAATAVTAITDRDRARSARHRRRSARFRTACSSRSRWRSRRSSTPRPPRAGSATRTSRKSRRT